MIVKMHIVWMCAVLFPFVAVAAQWTDDFDLDGDGRNDHIEVQHTGGAHCCYKLSVQLTRGQRYELPFQLDGGYVGGLDLSRPQQFAINSAPGEVPELLMQIETYNGKPQPLPPKWARQFGVRSHHIGVSFPEGRLRVRDLNPS